MSGLAPDLADAFVCAAANQQKRPRPEDGDEEMPAAEEASAEGSMKDSKSARLEDSYPPKETPKVAQAAAEEGDCLVYVSLPTWLFLSARQLHRESLADTVGACRHRQHTVHGN